MAKNAFLDWSGTATDNTDLAGLSTLGSAPVSNFDDIVRELMSQLRLALGGAATPVTMADAIAGIVAETRGWSPLRDKQAIDALAAKGTGIYASLSQTLVAGLTELVVSTFTATGPAVSASVVAVVEGASATTAQIRIDLVDLGTGSNVLQGVTVPIRHAANGAEVGSAPIAYTGLVRGQSYRLRVLASAFPASAGITTYLGGINA